MFRRGLAAQQAGRIDEAMTAYRRAIAQNSPAWPRRTSTSGNCTGSGGSTP
ncbi:MAG: tetratricopeptide repeat protein [Gemmatimonadales bacterium]